MGKKGVDFDGCMSIVGDEEGQSVMDSAGVGYPGDESCRRGREEG